MDNLYQTTQKRDFDWNFLISEERKRGSCRRFDFLPEPTKFLPFTESTYSDHFGPKTNFPPLCSEGPFPTPLVFDRAKHLVTTTQQDYDGRRFGTYTGTMFKGRDPSCEVEKLKKTISRECPEEILTTIGPVPLVKTCRQHQEWDTTYGRDFQYFPPKERIFPFPCQE